MIAIRANVLINRRGRVRFLAALPKFLERARAEPGCLTFFVGEDVHEANRFYLIGEYDSQDALDQHEMAAHTDSFRKLIAPLIEGREPTLVFTITKVEPLHA
jgi:quinol monooxygenase YgiN